MPNFAFGQLTEVTLDQKIETSTLIVEGKVVATKCYRNKNDEIYTANTIELNSILKGNYAQKTLVVTTWGGELDGELQTWTHLLTLEKGNYGLFFLEATRFEPLDAAQLSQTFDVYSGAQGLISFRQNESKAWVASDPFHFYKDIEAELYLYISEKTGQKMEKINENSAIKGSGLRYHFTDIAFSGSSVTFNVYVNSLVGTKNLYQSGIQLGYNPAFFGANIATNGNLQLTQAGISLSNAYNLSASNVGAAAVKIELLPVGTLSGYTSVGTSEQLLAKGKIVVQNPTAAPNISYNLAQMQSMSKYFEAGVAQNFDTVVVDGDWKVFNFDPDINSISPKIISGGTNETITIKGSNFGTYVEGVSKVWFYDASEGDEPVILVEPLFGDYNYWDNTKIIVQVPSFSKRESGDLFRSDVYAGNGLVKVCNANGACSIPNSLDNITVKFSVYNDRTISSEVPKNAGLSSVLRDANGEHGISIKFSPEFSLDADAKASIMRAINTWKCTTKVNWNTDENAPNNDILDMGMVEYGDLPTGTGSTTWAATPVSTNKCKDISLDAYVQAYQMEFKIKFNRNVNYWYKLESSSGLNGTKIDMQSAALHEFGHAHNLHHVNGISSVMYFSISKGENKRTLQPYDIEGGKWVINESFAIINGSDCPLPMYPADISGIDCSSVSTVNIESSETIRTYPNPVSDQLHIIAKKLSVNLSMIEIYDITGHKVLSTSAQNSDIMNGITLDIGNFPQGLYVLKVQIGTMSFSTIKFVKQ